MPINKIHLLIKKDDFILQSILQKSLYSISPNKKNKIIQKWIQNKIVKKNVNIVMKKGREPYILDKMYLKGIEYELLALALNKSDISIQSVKNLSFKDLNQAFENNENLDIIVGLKEKKDRYYYSKEFISFQNVAVSRKSSEFKINSINDLKEKKIIAFEGASLFLSKEFKNMFSRKSNNYKEEVYRKNKYSLF